MCMNYKLSRSKLKKKGKNGIPMSNEQLYDEEGNLIPMHKSIFATNDNSPNGSKKTSSSQISNYAKQQRIMPVAAALDEIEEEG